MSFESALSGLSGASQSLDVIGNNIANANTVGMKSSRVEFGDLISSAIGAVNGSTSQGIGVAVSTISENFTQGNVTVTGNNMDVAINGNGFFTVQKGNGDIAYTRSGQFKLDKSGNLMTDAGSYVLGYATTTAGGPLDKSALVPIQLPTAAPIAAKATANITAQFNLNGASPVATATTSPTQFGTSLTAYDTQGNAVPVNLYFVKSAADTWDAYTSAAAAQAAITSGTPAGVFQMTFDTSGNLLTPTTNPTLPLTSPNTNIGTFNVSLNIAKVTQYGTAFSVANLSQDGYTSGQFTGLTIGSDGTITSNYSNGQTQSNDQIQLTNFRNVQGLQPLSGGEFLQTAASGTPIAGAPGVGNFGALQSGAVEASNVDLTSELVNLMTAQRDYQANAQTIKTEDQVMSTLVNLR